ncbi:MAG TPA: hypothetical protein PK675_05700 [Clostridia bacterium]|nr:hypothetical protein [Clostridia bacterium]
MGKAFLAGQGQVGGQIVTGQITGNNTTTLEITDINTQPRFITFIIQKGVSDEATCIYKFLWFDDDDSANWIYAGNNVCGLRGRTDSSGAATLSVDTSRANANDRIGYYDSVNKKIVLKSYTADAIFLSTRTYNYLIGY